MQVPSVQILLQAWERSRVVAPQRANQALALLAAAYADVPRIELAQLSSAERDRLLLQLRQQIFGSRLSAVTVCPGCGTRLEMEFSADDISTTRGRSFKHIDAKEPMSFSYGEYEIAFRLPNSLDLAALSATASVDENRWLLISRVVLRAFRNDEQISPGELPEAVVQILEEHLADADPLAEVRLNLACAGCGRNWQAPFDIVSFLAREVDAWAVRLLREVHLLARAYSWREADILALSPWRRLCYLEMLGE